MINFFNPVAAAAMTIIKKLFLAVASRAVLEWLLFRVAESIVESTKTPNDDDFLIKVKSAYYGDPE